MKPRDIRSTFIDYFRDRGHKPLERVSLIPPDPDDPVLLVTSGMHPLTRYLEGEPHPLGDRLTGSQRCLRTTDLDEVGDDSHLTLFEMLGSWSLGDYTHEQSLRWGFDLLTEGYGIALDRLGVSVFGGSPESPPDEKSVEIWRELGMPDDRITRLGPDNWWPGPVGLCGPDSEIFIWTGRGEPTGEPGVDEGWLEVWNHVSMMYRRDGSGQLSVLPRQNVDTGLGFERLVTVLEGVGSVWETSHLRPWTDVVTSLWSLDQRDLRIVTDHLRSSVVLIGDGVMPSNTGRGYVLRRLLRRGMRLIDGFLGDLPPELIDETLDWFGLPSNGRGLIKPVLEDEERRYQSTLWRGRREVSRLLRRGGIREPEYQWLWDTHGLPREIVDEVRLALD